MPPDAASHASALAGVMVLEAGSLIAGPFAGRLLAEFGAEVIKLEAPDRPDPLREWGLERYEGHTLWWAVHSRNKKCVTLDLRRPGSECSAASGPTATRTTAPRSCAPSCASAAR
jgi:crotonobetainyl-CoA:carnitine CoA-transferase CaiB-like acyl-CoA transferase